MGLDEMNEMMLQMQAEQTQRLERMEDKRNLAAMAMESKMDLFFEKKI